MKTSKLILLSLCWASALPAMENKELTQEQLAQQVVDSVAFQVIQEIETAERLEDIEKNHLRIMALFASEQYTDVLSKTLEEAFKRFEVDVVWCCDSNYSLILPKQLERYPLTAIIFQEHTLYNALNSSDQGFKDTMLIFVAKHGYRSWVNKLLNAGADVNKQGAWENTALMWAARNGHTDIVEALIKAGADLNERYLSINGEYIHGETVLMKAAQNGYTDIATALINARADLNKQDNIGCTALIWAACYGHIDIVNALINARADVNIQNNYGDTALMLAAENGHTDIVNALIKADANLNKQAKWGETALINAAQKGHTEIVQLLEAAMADKSQSARND